MTEHELAVSIAEEKATSPTTMGDATLVALRITGTGVTWRDSQGFIFRPSEHYLTPEFLNRCNGLPVLLDHAATDHGMLDNESYKNQNIGSIIYPYVRGDEVWGVAKLYTDIDLTNLSTSPTVLATDTQQVIDGESVAIESKPTYIDHVAICAVGVWDKEKPDNKGILITTQKGNTMTEDEAAKLAQDEAGATTTETPAAPAATAPAVNNLEAAVTALTDIVMKLVDKVGGVEAKPAAPAAEAIAPKADSEEKDTLSARIDSLQATIEASKPKALADSDLDDIANVQAQADSTYTMLGMSAPKPTHFDDPMSYMRRVLAPLQAKSKAFGKVALSVFDKPTLFDHVAPTIFADAKAAAMVATDVPSGQAMPIRERREDGRVTTHWKGQDTGAMTKSFNLRPLKIAAFN